MKVRRPHAHRIFYSRSTRGRANPAASQKPALEGTGSFRAEGAARSSRRLSAIIRRLLSDVCRNSRTIVRKSVSECLHSDRRRTRKTGLAGIGRKIDEHEGRIPPVQSLPGLFSAALLPVSFLISANLLLPLRIEMPIKAISLKSSRSLPRLWSRNRPEPSV